MKIKNQAEIGSWPQATYTVESQAFMKKNGNGQEVKEVKPSDKRAMVKILAELLQA